MPKRTILEVLIATGRAEEIYPTQTAIDNLKKAEREIRKTRRRKKKREYAKRSREADLARLRAWMADPNNKERQRKYFKKWREKNKERLREYDQRRYLTKKIINYKKILLFILLLNFQKCLKNQSKN